MLSSPGDACSDNNKYEDALELKIFGAFLNAKGLRGLAS
jgi:hypothetical protein